MFQGFGISVFDYQGNASYNRGMKTIHQTFEEAVYHLTPDQTLLLMETRLTKQLEDTQRKITEIQTARHTAALEDARR